MTHIRQRVPHDFLLSVAEGKVSGHKPVHKFGRNFEVDTTSTPEDIWDGGGVWVPPTQARIHDLVSTSAQDLGIVRSSGTITDSGGTTSLIDTTATFVTDGVLVGDTVILPLTKEHSTVTGVTETVLTLHQSRHGGKFGANLTYQVVAAGGTGCSILHVYGLDADMNPVEEFLIPNGITPVSLTVPMLRINRMHIDGANGRDSTNVGDITATAEVDLTITSKITAGSGQTLQAIYTVPAGKTAYIHTLDSALNKTGGTAGAMANMALYMVPFASTDGAGHRLLHSVGLSIEGTSVHSKTYSMPVGIEEQTDLFWRCTSVTDNNMDITAGFDLILVDNDSVD